MLATGLTAMLMMVEFLLQDAGLSQNDAVKQCPSFSGTYKDSGVVQASNSAMSEGAPILLSLGVFAQAMPGLERPENVVLRTFSEGALLEVSLVGKRRFDFYLQLTCTDGRYRVERHHENQSAGEGVDLIRSTEVITLAPDESGITVRLMSESRYRTWPFFYRTESIDNVYRFYRVVPGAN